MTAATASKSASPADEFKDERTITEFWASLGESNTVNRAAANLPLGLGIFLYVPAYLLKALNLTGAIRYTLTNRRIRVDRGVLKKTTKFVRLEEIDDVRLANDIPFTRTGDLEIVSKGTVVLRLVGIQDPRPRLKTILDAVRSRIEVEKVLADQRLAAASA